jgi:hypothetical protein
MLELYFKLSIDFLTLLLLILIIELVIIQFVCNTFRSKIDAASEYFDDELEIIETLSYQ